MNASGQSMPGSAPGPFDVPGPVVENCAHALRRIRERHPRLRSIAVTSALPHEGRSTIARGLALAEHRKFGGGAVILALDSHPEAGEDRAKDSDSAPGGGLFGEPAPEVVEWEADGLGVMHIPASSGTGRYSPVGLPDLIGRLAGQGYLVVGDLPPLPPHGDADVAAGCFDVTAMVVSAGSTPAHVVKEAERSLLTSPVVILNRIRSSVPRWLPLRGGR